MPNEEEEEASQSSPLADHGYNIIGELGKGSYSKVFLAFSSKHGGTVAIKVIDKTHAPEKYLTKFLVREIQVARGLRHDNLIRYLQAIESTNKFYIITEYASNGSLLKYIIDHSYVRENRAKRWFQELMSGLEYCHRRGVTHRDIKCENILLGSQKSIKISDFGFAKFVQRDKTGKLLLSETYCGSHAYASPEILKGIPYDPFLADIWSSGVVLFAMVYGTLPYDDSQLAKLLKQVSQKVQFPDAPEVSADCKYLIDRMLSPLKLRFRLYEIKEFPWFMSTVEEELEEVEVKVIGIEKKNKSVDALHEVHESDTIHVDVAGLSLLQQELEPEIPKGVGQQRRPVINGDLEDASADNVNDVSKKNS